MFADEAARITPQHLAELPDRRRHAILAAVLGRLVSLGVSEAHEIEQRIAVEQARTRLSNIKVDI